MSLLRKLGGSNKTAKPGDIKSDANGPLTPESNTSENSEKSRDSAVKNSAADFTPAGVKRVKYALADFVVERTLGTGSFGRVHLVKTKTKEIKCSYYALKVVISLTTRC
jgi:hypothetical protein